MPYTQTTEELFKNTMPVLVSTSKIDIEGPILFEIEGRGGGTWTVDFAQRTVTEGQPPVPKVIVRAMERDFMALVEGRMSAADGILTKRLQLSGNIAAIARLVEAIDLLRGYA